MFEVPELLRAARDATGLDDFGDDSFREGLERLTAALRNEAKLNEIGVMVMHGRIVSLLSNRLQVEDWYRRHPDIDDEVIAHPLIGLGLPRTSSTALSFLLAQDPNARSLLMWESAQPCPPPSTVDGRDSRIDAAEAAVEMQKQASPRGAALVPSAAEGPMECQELMGLDFKAQYFQAMACIPSYSSWILDADLDSTYAYEKRVLKLLQWGQPTRPWRLKCPSHLLWLDHLDTAFPDARFVMTHRDPTDVIVSVADVYLEVASKLSDDVDKQYIGDVNVEHWTEGMRRTIAFRDADDNDDRFYDIDFRSVQADPIGEVRKLYTWLDEPVTDDFVAGMEAWWAEHAADRASNVHPDPAEFGIDGDRVHGMFEEYNARVPGWVTAQPDHARAPA